MTVFLLFISHPVAAHEFECATRGDITTLPEAVLKTRQEIMSQAAFGNMLPMQEIADQNEIWPVADFGPDANYEDTPIQSWLAQSQDTEGRYILAQMIEVLSMPYLKKPLNGGVDLYIWPYFADQDLTFPCTLDMVELLKIISPTEYLKNRQTGLYTGFQLAISTDGTWQYFVRKNLNKNTPEDK